ncbi:ANTAR domain-containing protein [Streptomyces sp. NPDC001604]|uniref:ANTAR domain-containing protein n=1 Tax=Streptomyces sp. NPDC001604 TaxID=3364593 RepID=UPI0036C99295
MPEPAQEAQTCLVTIDVVPDGDRMNVRVCGELDHGGLQLERGLTEALDSSASGIDLDLSAIGFCDCSGLNLLLGLRRKALDDGKTITISASGPSVDRLLELTGARELFARPGADHDGSTEPNAAGDGLKAPEAVDQELRKEVAELRRAMQTRPAIDLARGILMASFSLSPEVAWTVLVTASQNTNTKLHVLAQDLVGTVQGTPLPEEVQQQLAAAVTQARAAVPLA